MVTADPRYPTWETFWGLIGTGAPALQPVPGSPAIHLFVDAGGGRIGMYAGASERSVLPPLDYADINLRWVDLSGTPHLELSTQAHELFHEFFSLLLVAADLIQRERRDPLEAILVSLRRWRRLLAPAELLSEDALVGLFGELWLLRRLMTAHGALALDQWVGPRAEPHDFRLGQEEIEVKTTRSANRTHTIHGLQQLEPWPGRPLHILSLQLALAGGAPGKSVPDLVAGVRTLLGPDNSRQQTFEYLLEAGTGYAARHEDQYGTRYQIRSQPTLVLVDDKCPRITSAIIGSLPSTVQTRLDLVSYRVNLEGLGSPDGSPAFLRLIP